MLVVLASCGVVPRNPEPFSKSQVLAEALAPDYVDDDRVGTTVLDSPDNFLKIPGDKPCAKYNQTEGPCPGHTGRRLITEVKYDTSDPCQLKLTVVYKPVATELTLKDGVALKIVYFAVGGEMVNVASTTLTPDMITMGQNNTWGPFVIGVTQKKYHIRAMAFARRTAVENFPECAKCATAGMGVPGGRAPVDPIEGEMSHRWDNYDLRLMTTDCVTVNNCTTTPMIKSLSGSKAKMKKLPKCQPLGVKLDFCDAVSVDAGAPFYGQGAWAKYIDGLARVALDTNYSSMPVTTTAGRSDEVSPRCAALMKALTCARYFQTCNPIDTSIPEDDFCPCQSLCEALKSAACPTSELLDCNRDESVCSDKETPELMCFSSQPTCTSYPIPPTYEPTPTPLLTPTPSVIATPSPSMSPLPEANLRLTTPVESKLTPTHWLWSTAPATQMPNKPFSTSSVVAAARAAANAALEAATADEPPLLVQREAELSAAAASPAERQRLRVPLGRR